MYVEKCVNFIELKYIVEHYEVVIIQSVKTNNKFPFKIQYMDNI